MCKGTNKRVKYKEKTLFFFYFRAWVPKTHSVKGTIKWAEYKKKCQISFCILEREYLRCAASKVRISEWNTKKKHFFSFISEREYLRCAASKVRISEWNTKKKHFFLLFPSVSKMRSIKGTNKRVKYKEKNTFFFYFRAWVPKTHGVKGGANRVKYKINHNLFCISEQEKEKTEGGKSMIGWLYVAVWSKTFSLTPHDNHPTCRLSTFSSLRLFERLYYIFLTVL